MNKVQEDIDAQQEFENYSLEGTPRRVLFEGGDNDWPIPHINYWDGKEVYKI